MLTELLNKASNTSEDILLSDSLLENEYIEHHGTKGQKWGVRRYQNSDGSLTEEGRRRYGVGPALGSVKKAAGKAIRKAIGRQTDEELDAELSKAAHKKERRDKKELIDELSGKHKRLSQMTDRELDDFINRKAKEIKARQLEKGLKEENRGEIEKFMRNAAKGLASDAVSGIGSGVKKSIETSLTAREARKQEAKDAYAAQKLAKKLEGRRSKYETEEQRLAREADNAKRRRDVERDNTEARAFQGDKKAQDMMNRSQNKWKADEEDSPYKKAAKNAEDKRKLAEEQLRSRALSGDPEANTALREYQEASSGRRSQKESKSEKKIRKADQDAKLADAKARKTEAETRQKTLEGDADAKQRYTGWSDAKKGTPKNQPRQEDKPKDETPKDKTPKDETPKDIVPKDETPKDEAPKKKKKKNNGSAKHSDFSNIDIESEYVGSLVVDGFISYHSDISFD